MNDFVDLNNDQRREKVNSDQRYWGLTQARQKAAGFRGSMVWHSGGDVEHLVHSYYNSAGVRRQKSLGRRSPETEATKAEWDTGRESAKAMLEERQERMARQAAVNRALRLGRVPTLTARIIRALDDYRLLGAGIRIAGTNAIYAYEAAAGIFVDPGITATLDIDLLMNGRRTLKILADPEAGVENGALINLLRKVDKSFERTRSTFRVTNREGYIVDLIKPLPKPVWRDSREQVGDGDDELIATRIEGLTWLENAPPFEAIAIDERGNPLRMVTPDPRIFAAHKLWVSQREDREPIKRRRDEEQAKAIARVTALHFPHLPYEHSRISVLPRSVYDAAAQLFAPD